MANHLSAMKRIRQNAVRRTANRYFKKTARTAIKKLRSMEDKAAAVKFLPRVVSMVDRLAKSGAWHKNKASNIKSSLMRYMAAN
ncbi:MAG: 30S ribosomal protein S20 [Saprospiraceae bacterium]|jgi:small subunit ribosomal protein S20|nr:30S ribosomal protein S20 [Saprospiraceae bacterium]MBP9209346.1 30S ribosomal protein S20 [Saprospiraceae bacterium]MBV6474246.1 30S ribosomal protein S20 [Saprospiraceae bacterium]